MMCTKVEETSSPADETRRSSAIQDKEVSNPADEARKLRAMQDEEYFAMLNKNIAKVRNLVLSTNRN